MVVTARRAMGGVGLGLVLLATGTACGVTAAPSRAAQVPIPPLAGTEPNGEQLRSGSQLYADARASLAGAATVHLAGSLMLQGVSTPIDIISDRGGDVSGSLGGTSGALQIQFSRSAGEVYVRPTGNAGGLVSQLGLPAGVAAAAPLGDFWALDAADTASVMALTSLGLPALTSTLLPATLAVTPTLGSGDVDGTPVVTAEAAPAVVDAVPSLPGLTVSVAVTGAARLVRLTGGVAAASLDVQIGKAAAPALPTPAATPNP